jgi:hypothetical protein
MSSVRRWLRKPHFLTLAASRVRRIALAAGSASPASNSKEMASVREPNAKCFNYRTKSERMVSSGSQRNLTILQRRLSTSCKAQHQSICAWRHCNRCQACSPQASAPPNFRLNSTTNYRVSVSRAATSGTPKTNRAKDTKTTI